MKTRRTCYALGTTTAILFALMVLTTCKGSVGLGGTVDINPPKIESIYPPIGAVIKDSFIVAVKASDDTRVKHVGVLVNSSEGKTAKQYLLDEENGYWSCEINPQQDKLKDGTYNVNITVQDGSGKEIKAETAFVIDNTPPLLVLQRPSTAAEALSAEDDCDIFGDRFLLVGEVYDANPVETLKITAKNKDGTKIKEEVLNHIPHNIRLPVDTFEPPVEQSPDQPKKGFYRGLYGTERKAGKKFFTYDLQVCDSAKVYQKPGNKGVGPGNSTNVYYLYDEIYTDILSKRKLSEVYTMKQKYSGNADDASSEEKKTVTISKQC